MRRCWRRGQSWDSCSKQLPTPCQSVEGGVRARIAKKQHEASKAGEGQTGTGKIHAEVSARNAGGRFAGCMEVGLWWNGRRSSCHGEKRQLGAEWFAAL